LPPIIRAATTLQWFRSRELIQTIDPQKEESGMKPLPILAAAALAAATFPSLSYAQAIECAAEVPAVKGGHWYYRLIDGRKCWYQGKPMMPKSSLYWPKSSDTDADDDPSDRQAARPVAAQPNAAAAEPAVKPTTDGRSIAAPTMAAESAPAAWPAPAANGISFESRWLGLHSRN
jgi:hypothetical protein